MSLASMKELLEAGVHFGHYTRRWNPKMRPYIFTERNGIHIVDLAQTVEALDRAGDVVRQTVADGGTVLFVGTKKQAYETIRQAAERVGMPYVTYRWLGGLLTNWQTMRQRVTYLMELENRRDRGEFAMLPKKEALLLEREIEKLNRRLGGIKDMRELPQLVYVVDVRREEIAVKEANKLKIPIVAIVDTNCDPDPVQYVIPSNDDAIRALKLITDRMADQVEEGMALRQQAIVDQQREDAEESVDTSQRVFDPFEEEQAKAEAEAAKAAEAAAPDAGEPDAEAVPQAAAEESAATADAPADAAVEATAETQADAPKEAPAEVPADAPADVPADAPAEAAADAPAATADDTADEAPAE